MLNLLQLMSKRGTMIVVGCLVVLLAAGCGAQSVRTYDGQPRPLEEVAVLITGSDDCQILTVDGQEHNIHRNPNGEFHLLPGSHSVEVYWRTKGINGSWSNIAQTSINHTFNPGQVYAVKTRLVNTTHGPDNTPWTQWAPYIEIQGSVQTYAAEHPQHFSSSKDWKGLRKRHGLAPSFWDIFSTAKNKNKQQSSQF